MADLLTAALILGAVVVGLAVGFLAGRAITTHRLELGFAERVGAERKDAVRRSRSTLSGQFLEEMAPHFPDFPYNPKDLRFIGDPIDYVVFDGLTDGDLREIVLLEVKSGRSTLKSAQRAIRDLLEDGGVRWDLYRVPAGVSERT